MDIAQNEVEYLANTLQTHVVTYHIAARALNIHVTKSKEILLAYYNANKSRLTASFVATGTVAEKKVVKMFHSEAELNTDLQNSFDKLSTVHIYCVSSQEHSFSGPQIALEELSHVVDVTNVEKYHELGLTKGPALKFAESSRSVQPRPGPRPQKEVKEAPKEAPKTTAQKPVAYQSRKEKTKPSLLSHYVSRKNEKTAKREEESSEKPAYQYKSRKVEKTQPKERVISSMDHEDEEMEPHPKPETAKSDVNNLFLDDLSDFSDEEMASGETEIVPDVEKDEPIVVREEPEEERVLVPQVPEDSIFRSMASGSSALSKPPTPAPEHSTTIDEEGYITTFRPKTEAKAKPGTEKEKREPATAGVKPKKTDGRKKQASVMSFFGKR